jgi:hypothetical protein
LAKQKVQDSLRHKIDHRPTREELIEHNILKGKRERENMPLVWINDCDTIDSDVAPALQRTQAELERSRLEDDMERKIWKRPAASELVEQGILEGKQNRLCTSWLLTSFLFMCFIADEAPPQQWSYLL